MKHCIRATEELSVMSQLEILVEYRLSANFLCHSNWPVENCIEVSICYLLFSVIKSLLFFFFSYSFGFILTPREVSALGGQGGIIIKQRAVSTRYDLHVPLVKILTD